MIADDDDSVRLLIGAALDGYSVFEVTRGDDALALARLEQPDLVLLDVEMPGLDGLAVARALADGAATAAIPVVLCSGAGPAAAQVAQQLPNVFGFLAKPFSIPALQTLVEAALEGRRGMPVERAETVRATVAHPIQTVLWYADAAPAPVTTDMPLPMRHSTGHRHLPGTRYGRPSVEDARTGRRPSEHGRLTG